MRRYLLVAAATLTGLAPVVAAPVGAAAGGTRAAPRMRSAPGARLWVARYTGRTARDDVTSAMAVGPGGRSADDDATVAYDAATGRQLWVRRYNGPASKSDVAWSVGRLVETRSRVHVARGARWSAVLRVWALAP